MCKLIESKTDYTPAMMLNDVNSGFHNDFPEVKDTVRILHRQPWKKVRELSIEPESEEHSPEKK